MLENDFNKKLREELESFDIPMIPVDKAFEKFTQKKKSKKRFFFLFFISLIGLLLGSILLFKWNTVTNKNINQTDQVNNINYNQSRSADSSNKAIVEKDFPIKAEPSTPEESQIIEPKMSNLQHLQSNARATPNKYATLDSHSNKNDRQLAEENRITNNPAPEAFKVENTSNPPLATNLTPGELLIGSKYLFRYPFKKSALPSFEWNNFGLLSISKEAKKIPEDKKYSCFAMLATNDPMNVFPGSVFRKLSLNVGVQEPISSGTNLYLKAGINAFNLRRQYFKTTDTINGDIYRDSIRLHTLRQVGIGIGFQSRISKKSRLGMGFTYAWNLNIKGTNFETITKSSGSTEIVNKPYTVNRKYFSNLNFNTKGLNLNLFFATKLYRNTEFTIESNFGFTTLNNDLINSGANKNNLFSTPRALFFGLKYNFGAN